MMPDSPAVSAMLTPRRSWDIFCSVIDNFGDIGICWRLSRQLATEYAISVRLWVDDLISFQKICPDVDPAKVQQEIQGVIVALWSTDTNWQNINPADVVIEALACQIPQMYQQQMLAADRQIIWLNLEYLSAEEWVEDCHGVSSPQGSSLLQKYFFFPGFTPKTGGLLQEQDLQQRLTAFRQDPAAQQIFWRQLQVLHPQQYQQKISLFAYSHQQLDSLLKHWRQARHRTLCLIPEGALADQVKESYPQLKQQLYCAIDNLTLQILPFMPQPQYDYLLTACDVNFVRGEDSVIRAHWAARPFIWQIYRQQENAHLVKLQAFLHRYIAVMPETLKSVINGMFLNWNTEQVMTENWVLFSSKLAEIEQFNLQWRQQLTGLGDLSGNLVRFVEKKFIMPRNFS